MRKNKNPISLVWLALALDIIVFIITSAVIFKTSSFLLLLILAILLYILAYDAYSATSFIIKYYMQKQ